MGQTLAERIDWEAANDPNRMISAYAGDLADLVAELTARAERAEAALAAVPWQALLNIAASDAANDPDEAALLSFLNRYAPWVPPSDNDSASDA